MKAQIKSTGKSSTYKTQELGEIEIPKVGTYELELRGAKEGWQPIHLRSLKLIPVE